jgi:hypothetical protein
MCDGLAATIGIWDEVSGLAGVAEVVREPPGKPLGGQIPVARSVGRCRKACRYVRFDGESDRLTILPDQAQIIQFARFRKVSTAARKKVFL